MYKRNNLSIVFIQPELPKIYEKSRKHKEKIATSKENSEMEIDKQVNLKTASFTTALEEKKAQIQELK